MATSSPQERTQHVMCQACDEEDVAEPQEAQWLMGTEESRSLDWPFLCEPHRQQEIAAIKNGESGWEPGELITWWDINTQQYGEPTEVPQGSTT